MSKIIEEYGDIVILSYLMFAGSLLITCLPGSLAVLLVVLGICGASLWFCWKHKNALKILIEICSGKMHVKTKQKIIMRPKFFIIEGDKTSKVYKVQKDDEEYRKAINYLMKHPSFVETCCDFYYKFPTGMKLVEGNKFVELCSAKLVDCWLSKYIDIKGSIITLGSSEPIYLFLKNANSIWNVAFNKDFQKIFQLYKNDSSFEVPNMNNQDMNEIYFFNMSGVFTEQPQEEKDTETSCPNTDVLEHIKQIDEKLKQGMQLDGISNSQWNNVVRPYLMDVVYKTELNDKNKTEVLEILHQVNQNIKKEENEDYETEATLQAVRTYLSMSGCLKK